MGSALTAAIDTRRVPGVAGVTYSPSMPKKPSRPLGHIVFPKDGPAYREHELLPTDKDQLELLIARKFVQAMQARFGRTLAEPTRGDRFPDFLTSENGREIWLEVTEVVNPELRGHATTELASVSVEYARSLLTLTIREAPLPAPGHRGVVAPVL